MPQLNMDDAMQELSDAYDQYAKAICRHCSFRLFNKQDAEEVTQETFMRAWQYLNNGNTIDNLKGFLYRVANNLIIDRMRGQKKDVSLEALMEEGFEPDVQDKTDQIQKNLEVQMILGNVRAVKKEQSELLVMRYIHGMMPADIATKMVLSPNAVSVRLHRSIKQIASRQGCVSRAGSH